MIINLDKKFQKRKSNRQKVLIKSKIDVGSYYFEGVAYDLSLTGAKIKLNLPLERGAEFFIVFKDQKQIPSRISWAKDGYVGIEFCFPPEKVKEIFGSLGERLD